MQFCYLAITSLYTAGTLVPIPVEEFAEHVKKMHSNDDFMFSEEYLVSIY